MSLVPDYGGSSEDSSASYFSDEEETSRYIKTFKF